MKTGPFSLALTGRVGAWLRYWQKVADLHGRRGRIMLKCYKK